MSTYHRTVLTFILPFFFIQCEESSASSKSETSVGLCRLYIALKEEWSTTNNNAIRFLITAENTGELTIQTIEVTANLYFRNDYMFKVRFYLSELQLDPQDMVEEYGTFLDTNSSYFLLQAVSKSDLDRIIYNAPIYTCIDS